MENTCVTCGDIIPEGRQVCMQCEAEANEKYRAVEFSTILKRTSINLETITDYLVEADGNNAEEGIFDEEIDTLCKAICTLNKLSAIRSIK